MAPWRIPLVLWLLFRMEAILCYSRGAPKDSCNTLFPKHYGATEQHGGSICHFTTDKTVFTSTAEVDVKLICKTNFKGFIIQARNSNNMAVGTISFKAGLQLQHVNGCHGKPKATITHNDKFASRRPKRVTFRWKPDRDTGNDIIHFRATVVTSYTTVFSEITSSRLTQTRASCHAPEPLPNTELHVVGNDLVNYTCQTGYTQSGPMQARCTNGKRILPNAFCFAITTLVSITTPPSLEMPTQLTTKLTATATASITPDNLTTSAETHTNSTPSENSGHITLTPVNIITGAMFLTILCLHFFCI